MTDADAVDEKTTTWHVALLGGYAQRGRWQMRRRTIAISPVGGIDLDLTDAILPEQEATVVKVSFVGGAKLTVPAGVSVVVEGFNVIGPRRNDTEPTLPGGRTIHLFAYGIFGGVSIRTVR